MAKFSLGNWSYLVYFISAIIPPVLQLAVSYWLAKWTEMDKEDQQKRENFLIYVYICVGYLASQMLRAIILISLMLASSTGMHNKAIERVLRSPILFFDSNPSGRINTRFSKDIAVMDFIMS